MPKSGQFIAVWVYDGQLWASTCKSRPDGVYTYDESTNEWKSDTMQFIRGTAFFRTA